MQKSNNMLERDDRPMQVSFPLCQVWAIIFNNLLSIIYIPPLYINAVEVKKNWSWLSVCLSIPGRFEILRGKNLVSILPSLQMSHTLRRNIETHGRNLSQWPFFLLPYETKRILTFDILENVGLVDWGHSLCVIWFSLHAGTRPFTCFIRNWTGSA